MQKFLKKILLSALFCSVLPLVFTVAFFTLIYDELNGSYMAVIADKVERLAAIEEPKIILVGNSNLAFGIDSQTIEQAYGMPVVNMGLHGGLENALIEEITQDYIGEGDIVVLAHSSYNALTSELPDARLTIPMMVADGHAREVILGNYFMQVAKVVPYYMLDTSVFLLRGYSLLSADYERSSFNEYGDVAYARDDSTCEFTEGNVTSFGVSSYEVERVNAYNAYCESVGATLVVAGYPIADGEFTPAIEEIKAFQVNLEENLACQVISDFTDYLIPYKYFYDTYLHLNDAGVAIRTAQLIEDLQAVIAQ